MTIGRYSLTAALVVVVWGGGRGGHYQQCFKCPLISIAALLQVQAIVSAGGTVVLPSTSPLLRAPLFVATLRLPAATDNADPDTPPYEPTLAFAQAVGVEAGGCLHVMDMPYVRDINETVTGLAATGVHAILTLTAPPQRKGQARIAPGHPLVPVVHVGLQPSHTAALDRAWGAAADAVLVAAEAEAAGSEAAVAADFARRTLDVSQVHCQWRILVMPMSYIPRYCFSRHRHHLLLLLSYRWLPILPLAPPPPRAPRPHSFRSHADTQAYRRSTTSSSSVRHPTVVFSHQGLALFCAVILVKCA
jgi:hypothetical protein